ncbi:hypothetical protein [Acidiphilium angustum]|uniref:hypothetical protein n=1 Tax=Acidiphilium angustum TaxID=523 RepID=UPI00138E4362|nr:hypothetical protein [Acidiphilium angustum]
MATQSIDSVLKSIERKAQAVGFSKWGLAEFAGLHKNSLQGLFTPEWTPSISTIRRLEEALKPPAHELRFLAAERKIPLKPSRSSVRAKRTAPARNTRNRRVVETETSPNEANG